MPQICFLCNYDGSILADMYLGTILWDLLSFILKQWRNQASGYDNLPYAPLYLWQSTDQTVLQMAETTNGSNQKQMAATKIAAICNQKQLSTMCCI